MLMSKKELLREARIRGYQPEMFEKMKWIFMLLRQMMSVPNLKNHLVLKGGTALNLFYLNPAPRLAVDIDLNYLGAEHSSVTAAISQIFLHNQLERDQSVWRYLSVLEPDKVNLEVNLQFMNRQPLWPCIPRTPALAFDKSLMVSVLDIHELAAGQFCALFHRKHIRDLFDAHTLLTQCHLDRRKLRLAFVIYLAAASIELSSLQPANMNYDMIDLRKHLIPLLAHPTYPRSAKLLRTWADQWIKELRLGLSMLLPLTPQETDFIHQLKNNKRILPELITKDELLKQKIVTHPAIASVIDGE